MSDSARPRWKESEMSHRKPQSRSSPFVLRTTMSIAAIALVGAGCQTAPDPQPAFEGAFASQGSSGSGSSGGGGDLAPLSTVAVPQPVGDIINRAAAIRLGKALFWDIQTGGDGQVACASCHFHGGADSRLLNVLNPGPDGIFASGGVTSAGQLFSPSAITNDDRVGSQGVVGSLFVAVDPDP